MGSLTNNIVTASAPPASAGVSLRELRIGFGSGLPIIDNLSLEVAPGEILALLGASGCGKSTLLRSIARLQPLRSGEIAFSRMTRRWGDLAFVFQDATLLPWRTVEENVRLPLELGSSGEGGFGRHRRWGPAGRRPKRAGSRQVSAPIVRRDAYAS